MKVLVTGATGFLGSHLVHGLVARGDQPLVLKRSNSDLARLRDLAGLALYDADQGGAERLLAEHGDVAAVVHAATCYGRNGESDEMLLEANTLFPLRLLGQAVRSKVPLFIHTDTCFTLSYPYLKSYTLSKKQFSQWGEHIATRGDITFVNLKLEHPFGPHDAPNKFVSSILRQCVDNVEAIKLTPGEQRKDFIYVEDVVSAILLVLDRCGDAAPFQEYECGSGQPVSIRQFVETAHGLIGSRTRLLFGALAYRDSEIMYSCANTASLEDLGWSPRFSLEAGLERTLEIDYGFLSPHRSKVEGHASAVR